MCSIALPNEFQGVLLSACIFELFSQYVWELEITKFLLILLLLHKLNVSMQAGIKRQKVVPPHCRLLRWEPAGHGQTDLGLCTSSFQRYPAGWISVPMAKFSAVHSVLGLWACSQQNWSNLSTLCNRLHWKEKTDFSWNQNVFQGCQLQLYFPADKVGMTSFSFHVLFG